MVDFPLFSISMEVYEISISVNNIFRISKKLQYDLANGNHPPLLINALELLRSKLTSWELVRMNVGEGN